VELQQDIQKKHEREWRLRSPVKVDDECLVQKLQQETGLSLVTCRVCFSRGLKTKAEITEFLTPRLENLKDPSSIKDIDKAVERLVRARSNRESVRVFADYDVDGTTAAALLSWFFKDCGIKFDVRQPDRFKDGYGLNVSAVEEALADGVNLLVTVDCGVASHEAANRARELGIDLVVVDHHQIDLDKGIPVAHAVVDPHRSDCESGLKELCGCGLAFYLARALRSKGRDEGWWQPGSEPNLKQHLDLVVVATAADMVPLTGDNHILARHGLDVLKHTRKPGLKALLEISGAMSSESKALTPSMLGFIVGPRINASGRMSHANLACELLCTEDSQKATNLAQELERLNQERTQVQNRVWDEVRERVEKGISEGKFTHSIVVADPSWHEGVVGIVASRATETFNRPAAIIALRDEFGKGSVRSYGGKDILSALRESSQYLLGFGGHKHAAGLSIKPDHVDAFAEAFDTALASKDADPDLLPLFVEGECSIENLDFKTLAELERLGPFGPGNPEPVFTVRAAALSHRILKGRHIKLSLGNDVVGSGSAIEGIWFYGAEREDVTSKKLLEIEAEWAGVPELNRFRGKATPTLRIKDCRLIHHC